METLHHPWTAGTIFLAIFILIAFRRFRLLPIGRPAAALLGAVAMVVFGVMSLDTAYQLINWDTICLLLGMMILSEHLRAAGLFHRISRRLGTIRSPLGLLVILSASSALLSAVLVNDSICVIFTPLVLDVCEHRRLNPFPYLMALATSTNIGSALTLAGNPQNMIIGTLSGISYTRFLVLMVLPAGMAWLLNLAFLYLYYGRNLDGDGNVVPSSRRSPRKLRRLEIGILALVLTCAGFLLGFPMALSALVGAVVVIVFHRKDPSRLMAEVKWSLLLFFAALFVVIGGLKTSGLAPMLTRWALALISGSRWRQVLIFSGMTLVGSNLFSNVPFVLLASPSVGSLSHPELFWCLLAYVSTMAGNLTLLGSVNNIIVAESSRGRCAMTFSAYARFGIPATLVSLLLGLVILYSIFPF